MFAWLPAANMSPLGDIGIFLFPREFLITSTLEAGAGSAGGLYLFPADPDAEVASGFMVLYPDNMFFGDMTNQIALEFFKDVLQELVPTILMVWAGITGLFSRLGFAAGVGLLAAVTTNLSLAIWYGFPLAYALGASGITLVSYVVAGVGIALILPRQKHLVDSELGT